ncbi:MAG TPA: T9SS type A sorting domain-containing protein [Bacteroidales bacterium]|nr:T9SS type A sorting domain-containing protein [Bacteroidales bacterium]HRZ48390.1 T9SS type A sorting domain-containing protein [Bacteroidales bacterium]
MNGTHQWVPGAYYGDTAVLIDTGSFYKCYHQIAPNGGGDSVNRYALMFDFMVPDFSVWHTFHQTDSTNMNDGECFIKPQTAGLKSTIGTATTGYTPDSISPGVWYRMVISVCLDSFYRYYIDGNLWLEGDMQVLDGRFALTPLLLFFADNNQEDGPIHISSVAIFNNYLTAAEVALLGNLDPCMANPPEINLGKDTVLCENHILILDAGPGYKSYLWSTGATTQMVALDTTICGAGTSSISVMAVNMNDCEASDTLAVTFINCSSVDDLHPEANVRVYPNPVGEQLTLETAAEDCVVTLLSPDGKIVWESTITAVGTQRFDTRNLPAGLYFLQITNKGVRSVTILSKL